MHITTLTLVYCRTDKGVHAAKTVVVGKLLVDQGKFCTRGLSTQLKDSVNAHLPPDVRVFSVCKVSCCTAP
jgi:tRNA U38,U39,U40 pseudouridine synthase TruA